MEIKRKIKPEDEKSIAVLFEQLTGAKSKFDIQKIIQDQNCHPAILRKGGEIIGCGFLILHLVPSNDYVGKIEDVVVNKSHRGQGLGRIIMEELLKIAKENNINVVNLTSNPARISARNLYESMGFKLRDTGVFRKEL